jgi:hypothetical protein
LPIAQLSSHNAKQSKFTEKISFLVINEHWLDIPGLFAFRNVGNFTSTPILNGYRWFSL